MARKNEPNLIAMIGLLTQHGSTENGVRDIMVKRKQQISPSTPRNWKLIGLILNPHLFSLRLALEDCW